MITREVFVPVLAAALGLLGCGTSVERASSAAGASGGSAGASSGGGGQGGSGGESGGASGGGRGGEGGGGSLEICECLEGIGLGSGCTWCVAQAGDHVDVCYGALELCNVSPGCVDILQCLADHNYASGSIDGCLEPWSSPHDAPVRKVFTDLMQCACGQCVPDCGHETSFTCLADTPQ